MVIMTLPSAPIRTKALGSKAFDCASPVSGRLRLSSRPPPAAVPLRSRLRRVKSVMVQPPGLRLRCLLDRLADADIGTATADVAGHRAVDVGVGRRGRLRK